MKHIITDYNHYNKPNLLILVQLAGVASHHRWLFANSASFQLNRFLRDFFSCKRIFPFHTRILCTFRSSLFSIHLHVVCLGLFKNLLIFMLDIFICIRFSWHCLFLFGWEWLATFFVLFLWMPFLQHLLEASEIDNFFAHKTQLQSLIDLLWTCLTRYHLLTICDTHNRKIFLNTINWFTFMNDTKRTRKEGTHINANLLSNFVKKRAVRESL